MIPCLELTTNVHNTQNNYSLLQIGGKCIKRMFECTAGAAFNCRNPRNRIHSSKGRKFEMRRRKNEINQRNIHSHSTHSPWWHLNMESWNYARPSSIRRPPKLMLLLCYLLQSAEQELWVVKPRRMLGSSPRTRPTWR